MFIDKKTHCPIYVKCLLQVLGRRKLDKAEAAVQAGTWSPKIAEVEFDLAAFNADVDATNAKLMEALHGA